TRVEWRGGTARAWTRRWWAGEAGAVGRLADLALLPAEGAFRAAAALRRALYARGLLSRCEPALPVVSVGNLRVGGSGKTPLVRWIVECLAAHGRRPAVVHGGYAQDEPTLLRSWLPDVPVVALRDRCAAVERARAAGADVAVLDDAFQHLRMPRRLDVVLVPAESWSSAPRLLPRGGWREPPAALERAQVVLVTRKTATPERAAEVAGEVARLAPTALVARFRLETESWRRWPAGQGGRPAGPALLVAAIAEPGPFLAGARAAGAEVREAMLFPDHHPYTDDDVRRIRARARQGPIVTTEKDAVKLEGRVSPLWVLPLRAVPEEGGAAFEARLREVLA
ncbi:MAG TPA: tetraacyldisaccharide 4'-kinase, partial [Longimicrobiales bacterium]|nr:tetraacyldisaccharide 4'-kinase [Longimicrobiales bacterium]